MAIRTIRRVVQAAPTLEGAGVRLHRAFGFGDSSDYDPFLLLDDFRSDDPEDYRAGFPMHPHRGIETITYVLAGNVEHRDSLGNHGVIGPGDVQWMTAGRGIIHEEMPRGDAQGRMHGFQLWANLPAALKMTEPRYQEVKAEEIPEVASYDGARVRIICGRFRELTGVVRGIAADPVYLDVSVPPRMRSGLPVASGRHAFAYVFAGSGAFGKGAARLDAGEPPGLSKTPPSTWERGREDRSTAAAKLESRSAASAGEPESLPFARAGNRTLVLFDEGGEILVEAGDEGVRFLLVSGVPLREPVAWRGPIVMNTQDELRAAFAQLREGTFLQARSAG